MPTPEPATTAATTSARPDTVRWLFADQLGPSFLDHPEQRVLLVESRKVFARRRFHRQKAHLVLSAMRHRAAELGERCTYVRADRYADAVRDFGEPLTVCHPTSRSALRLVGRLPGVEVLPARGYATSMEQFDTWVRSRGQRRLLLEDFYRESRRRFDILLDGDEPVGGRWNYDADNREPAPRSGELDVPAPWWPTEDAIDEEVRADLDRWEADGDVSFVGVDGPRRFAATRDEARQALAHFVEHRLDRFGPTEDAVLADDPWMSHSLLSAPLNLGLLEPLEMAHAAEEAYRSGDARLPSVEGFVRQVIGWRDYVWHLYWQQDADYRDRNALRATTSLPEWFAELDGDAVQARCLSTVLGNLRNHGWVHHIPRLMILGNYAMQHGWQPAEVTDWFHRSFVDGYDWVMVPNVVGMSQHADGGVMATKPYAAGGAYIDRMTDFCKGCRYDPKVRVGEKACPYTAGYWAFLHRHKDSFARNHRMAQAVRGLDRLKDLEPLLEQEAHRGSEAP
ncbi:cryptochrome/photolyase family protein [Nakamurella deserti]|uniref:cryptochrome/photolyase family protein n=1 Tax=Nakamurella deserti TaxID=2164074 RepID=UPI001F0CAF87|nr:cryptochrome/photolyase family protein [Nakamurella deserti]